MSYCAGGDAVIIAGLNNKHLFKFIAQKEIREPADLRGKKIGVANFGGSNEFAALIALKKWNVPKEAVTLVAAGGGGGPLGGVGKNNPRAHPLSLHKSTFGAWGGV